MAIATETIVLKVEAQTDGAIRATERLAQAQQKLADGFKSAVAGGDDMMTRLGDGIKGIPSIASNLGESLKSIGFDAKSLSGGLKDIGKGLTFDLIRGGIKSLNQDIGSTASAAVSAAVSGASMGAAFGGPVGAAVGGLAGAFKGLITHALDAEEAFKKQKKVAEEEAKAYWDSIHAAERKKAIAEELAPALAAVAQQEKEIADLTATTKRIMGESSEAYRRAVDEAGAYHNKLMDVNFELREQLKLRGQLAGEKYASDPTAGGIQTSDEASAISASRGKRDAMIDAYAATKSYGKALVDLERTENTRNDRMRDLEGIMGDVNVSEAVRNRALKEYNDVATEAAKKTAELAQKYEEARQAGIKAWRPVVDAMNRENNKPDPWASARQIEARAAALADYEISVDEKTEALERLKKEPDLEADLRGFDADEALKKSKIDARDKKLEMIFGPIEDIDLYNEGFEKLGSTFNAFGEAVGASYEAIVTGQGSVSKAFRTILADGLMSIGKSSAIEALRETALGFASLALGPIGGASAAMHFQAAALHGAVAVAAGAAANQLGTSAQVAASDKAAGEKEKENEKRKKEEEKRRNDGGSGGDRDGSARPIQIIVGEWFAEESPRSRRQKADAAVERALRERDE